MNLLENKVMQLQKRFFDLGAKTTLISGPTSIPDPVGPTVVKVKFC